VRVALIGIDAEKLNDMVAEAKGLPSTVFICEDAHLGTTVTPRTAAHSHSSAALAASAVGAGALAAPTLTGSNTLAGVLGNQYMHNANANANANLQSHIEVSNMKEIYALVTIFLAYRHKHPAAHCIFSLCLDEIELTSFPHFAHHASDDAFRDASVHASPSAAAAAVEAGSSGAPRFSLRCLAKLHFVEMPTASPVAMQTPATSMLSTPTGFFKERAMSPGRSQSSDSRSVQHLSDYDANGRRSGSARKISFAGSGSGTGAGAGTGLAHESENALQVAARSVLTRHQNAARRRGVGDAESANLVNGVSARYVSQSLDALTSVVQHLHRLDGKTHGAASTHVPYRCAVCIRLLLFIPCCSNRRSVKYLYILHSHWGHFRSAP
jgi:hypothetical protein